MLVTEPVDSAVFHFEAKLEASNARVKELQAKLETATARVGELEAQLAEYIKLCELQQKDLERYQKAVADLKPHCPERVPREQLQLALQQVLSTADAATAEAANDVLVETRADADEASADSGEPNSSAPSPELPRRKAGRKPKRRVPAQLPSNMPVRRIEIHPPEVANNPEDFVLVGEEISEKVAFVGPRYERVQIVRYKWVPKAAVVPSVAEPASEAPAVPTLAALIDADCSSVEPSVLVPCSSPVSKRRAVAVEDIERRVLIAPLPDWVWPRTMADPSAIANVIVSKYDDILPLHRQERISLRHGFHLPRSTQCGWLEAAFAVSYRIVDAMFEESKRTARCIATDATGAPVQGPGKCHHWHVFVFIADNDHIVFRHSTEHTSAAITQMLDGFKGYLLADAATIFDVLFREHDMTEVSCWQHARRYFWKALETDTTAAFEALALIAQLFAIERLSREVPMPERTEFRAKRARVVQKLLDDWIVRHEGRADQRGRLDKAIGYYNNQHASLWRFLDDGHLRIDNSISEGQLRNLALGRDNWRYFYNRTGLDWYTTFRSLIASCHLHRLNPQLYLERMLRLAPHWSTSRMLELSPKYWIKTFAQLTPEQRSIAIPPWAPQDAEVTMQPIVGPAELVTASSSVAA